MFKLNLKIALRNLLRHKLATVINISGLAIGLTACLMLCLYVAYEWNYDRNFKNPENIYQVMVNFSRGKEISTGGQTPNVLSATLKEEMPEIEQVSRVTHASKRLLAVGQNSFKVNGRYADPELLKIFDYQFISGHPETALTDPNSIVLTESTAKRLFGSVDVLNRIVRFEGQQDLKVTAVIKDLPSNVTYDFECLNSITLYEKLNDWVGSPNWSNYAFYTLLTLKNGTDLNGVNGKLKSVISRHSTNNDVVGQPFLYPLIKIHLYGEFVNGYPVGGQIEQVRIFAILALSVLIIACINFMNLATARSQKRAKEVGIRKTIGASRRSLVWQFLLESLLLTIVSVVVAIVLLEMVMPSFNNLLDIKLQIAYSNPMNWLAVISVILFTGLIAGSYPAFFLSAFNPSEILKKKGALKNRFSLNFRQILVVVQFSFAVILIVATTVIYQQLQYLKNKPLGYQSEALVEMPHEGLLYLKYDLLKARLLASGAVTAMCQSSGSISSPNSNSSGMEWPGMSEQDKMMSVNQIFTAYDFIKTNGIKLLEGRDFKPGLRTDSTAVLLSKTAIRAMNLKNPVGKYVQFQGAKREIVGVFEDVIWGDISRKEKPMVISFNALNSDVIMMRINREKSIKESINLISQITKEINPDFPVDLKFVDLLVAEKLKNERILGLLSNLFGGLSIFISCLGLFGLSAFSAEQRTKEIGVRKVLGASIMEIVRLLSLSFIKTVFVALVIALPLAYLLMNSWLMKFDYHAPLGLLVFLFTAIATVMIALLTVSWQAFRSAKTNPVTALKYE